MKKGRWIAAAMGAGILTVVACGGSSDNPPNNGGGNDAGAVDSNVPDTNVADTNVADTNTADTNTVCTVDADTSGLPDAAINDAGASVGTCLACTQTKCASQSAACAADCTCAGDVQCIYQNCLQDLGNFGALAACAQQNACIGGFPPSTATALITCVNASCHDECGIPATPDAGPDSGDAGETDASDAGHD